ncbi:extracellular solute-binding protein [Vagococcus zengguangii]|nr:extracellular solute-binding protein [Vagococcus zengguangii]
MKKKQLILMFSSIILGTLVLSGCGKSSNNKEKSKETLEVTSKGFPIVKEETTFSMMGPNVGVAEWKDMPFFQDYAEKTGINWTFTTPPNADFSTKLNLALASGDLPDVIFAASSNNLTASMEMEYGGQGTLIPLESLIDEYMPNLSKLMDENENIRKSLTTPDGHIYSLPAIQTRSTSIWPRWPMWYNGEWLEALNVKERPKTTDEFYDLLVRMRDEDPNGNGKKDEIPLVDVQLDNSRPWLMAAFGLTELGIENMDGKAVYTPITENYKAFLEYMHKLYTEGLLDPETYSQAQEQVKAKGQNDRLGVFQDYYSYFTVGTSEADGLKHPMFAPLTSDYSEEPVVPIASGMQRSTLSITSKAESPEAIARWADYFYSEEGAFYMNFGPENSFWKFETNDEGKQVRVYTDEVNLENTEDTRGTITPAYGIAVPTIDTDWPEDYQIRTDKNQEIDTTFNDFMTSETETKIAPYGKIPFPLVYMTDEENEVIKEVKTDLSTYLEQMEAKFITGVKPLSEWYEYVETTKSMGLDKYVEVYQSALDCYNNS